MIENHYKNLTTHLFWTTGVLIFIIIMILTANLGARQDLKDTLSFAVSFASLVLAIIAIGQALLASSATSSTQAVLFDNSQRINSAVTDLSSVSERLPLLADKVQDSIKDQTRLLTDAVEQINGMVASVGERQDLMLRKQEQMDASLSVREKSTTETDDDQFELNDLTNGQYAALYLIVRSFDKGKIINVDDAVRPYDANYYSGVIATLKSFRYVDLESTSGLFRIKSLGKLAPHADKIRKFLDVFETGPTKEVLLIIDKWAEGVTNSAPASS